MISCLVDSNATVNPEALKHVLFSFFLFSEMVTKRTQSEEGVDVREKFLSEKCIPFT